jgi:hypothetical protein
MRRRSAVAVGLALVALSVASCGKSGGDGGGGGPTTLPPNGNGPSSSVKRPSSRIGKLETVFVQNVTVDDEITTSARDLTAGSTLVSDGHGQFVFSLTNKIQWCQTDPASKLQLMPSSGELIRWFEGRSYCRTTKDPGTTKVVAGPAVLVMDDPTFGVVMTAEAVVVKVYEGKLRVMQEGAPTTEVREGQQFTVPVPSAQTTSTTGRSTLPPTSTVPPRAVPAELSAREKCIFKGLQGDAPVDCSRFPAATTTTIDDSPPTVPTALEATTPIGAGCVVRLTWKASTDNVGVLLYIVFRNERVYDSVKAPATTFDDEKASQGTWTYWVEAADAAGNQSKPSASVRVPGCPG